MPKVGDDTWSLGGVDDLFEFGLGVIGVMGRDHGFGLVSGY